MKSINISLRSMQDAIDFVNVVKNINGKASLSRGRYTINAKSIMSIFYLDLTKQLKLEIENWKEEYATMLERYQKN